MKNNLFDEALNEAKQIRKALTESTVNDVVSKIRPQVESILDKKLNEADSVYPKGYHETDLDDTLATEDSDSYDDLAEMGDGDAVTEGANDFEEVDITDETNEEVFEDEEMDLDINVDDETNEADDMDLEFDLEEAFEDDEMTEAEGEDVDVDVEEPAPAPEEEEEDIDFEMTTDDETNEMEELTEKYESSLKENIRLKKQIRSLKVQNKDLNEGVTKLTRAITILKESVKQAKLDTEKLVLANKFLNTRRVDEKVRAKFVAELSKAKTLNESNAVYNKYRKYAKIRDNKVGKLNESAKQSPAVKSELPVDVSRFKTLAGI